MLYAFFWVITWLLNSNCQIFGTLCSTFVGGYEYGTDRVFRKFGTLYSDSRELPRREHTTFTYKIAHSTRWSLNSLFKVRFDFGRQLVHFRVSKTSIIGVYSCRPFLIIFIFLTVAFREKHGLVRNDFLDCMMELRQASKDEVKRNVQSTDNANTGATFSKLQHNIRLGETGYYTNFSEKC
jgi:hypothetical protein